MFWLNGTHVQAHRYSYERFVGPIPEGFFACHKCDTPACVNPNHLFAGTRSDNAQDMVRKGRAAKGKHTKNRKRGCDHPDAKLNDAKVRLIRSSSESQKALGLKFGVSNVAIRCVRIGKTWKHVDQEISP